MAALEQHEHFLRRLDMQSDAIMEVKGIRDRPILELHGLPLGSRRLTSHISAASLIPYRIVRRGLLDGQADLAAAKFRPMRRNVYDPLEQTREPRWYAVRNMYGAVLEARVLPPGVDLKRTFVAAMLEWIDAGWQLGEFSSRAGVFFAQRGIERRQIEITPGSYGRDRGVGTGTK